MLDDSIRELIFDVVRSAIAWLYLFIKHGSVKKANVAMVAWRERRQSVTVGVVQVFAVLLMAAILVMLFSVVVRCVRHVV